MSLTTNPFSKEKGFIEKGCAVYGNEGDKKLRMEEMVESSIRKETIIFILHTINTEKLKGSINQIY